MTNSNPGRSDPTLPPRATGVDATIGAAGADLGASREGPGAMIGPYRIVELIGEGGFGSVFMAEQERPVQRSVALKIIKLGMDTRQVVSRFEQERQALAMMDHPHIAKVFDAGATETGRPFFVMELVKGEPIVEYCDRESLSIPQRLELFVQVCAAVQHAHTKGIIHRDIKPSNILVGVQDGRPSVKVIDFGIAKATGSQVGERTLLTEHRQLIGTPEYMSPEQAEGSLDIDTRTDVYSLGVLLYELLTGTTPFTGKELRSAAYAEIQRIIREVEPPMPSTRLSRSTDTIAGIAAKRDTEPRKLGALVRGELDWIVMKAMEKDRQRRYETASGLMLDIRRFLAGEAVVAAPPSTAYRFRKFVRRHRVMATAGSAVGAALLVGVVAFAWQARVALDQRDRAVAAETEARKRADELAKVAEFQAGMLSQVDASDAGVRLMSSISAKFASALEGSGVPEAERGPRTEVFGRELQRVNGTDVAAEMIDRTILKPAIKAVDEQFKSQPAIDAKLRQALSELYRGLGLYDPAFELCEQALATRRRVLGEEHPDTLHSINDKGVLLESMGKFPEAERAYKEAFERRRKLLGEDHPDALTSMSNLGNFYRSQNRPGEAEPILRSAVEKDRRVLGPEHRDTLSAINCLGYLYIEQGKLAEAEPLWREAYETGRRALGESDPDVIVWVNNLAGLLQAQGKLKDAEALYRESLEKHRQVRGEEHPNTLGVAECLGSCLLVQGRYAEADQIYREVLEKSGRVLGKNHPTTLRILNNLGDLLDRWGRLEEAEKCMRGSLEGLREVYGADHPNTLVAMSRLAHVLASQERYAEGEALFQEVLEKSRRILGPEHPSTLVAEVNLGNLLLQAGRADAAEPFIREVVETRRRVSGEEHPETLIAISNLGQLLEMQGKLAEAEAVNREVLVRFRKVRGEDHPTTLNAILSLASVLRSEGRHAEAEPLCREAVGGMEKRFGKESSWAGVARLKLGRTLTDLSRFTDAEVELIEAQRVLSAAQGVTVKRRVESLTALGTLYEAWEKAEPGKGRGEKGVEWKAKLDAAEAGRRDEKDGEKR